MPFSQHRDIDTKKRDLDMQIIYLVIIAFILHYFFFYLLPCLVFFTFVYITNTIKGRLTLNSFADYVQNFLQGEFIGQQRSSLSVYNYWVLLSGNLTFTQRRHRWKLTELGWDFVEYVFFFF